MHNKINYSQLLNSVKIPISIISPVLDVKKEYMDYKIEQKLLPAIQNESFELYFQPQFSIKNNHLRGFEALIRWEDKDLGCISPSCFIPIAERTSAIVYIGWWVMEKAMATLKSWQNDYEFKGIVSVNVSPIQLKEPNFLSDFKNLLKKYKINPHSLELEITENKLIVDIQQAIQILESIKNENVFISLDDFGTGYSSFQYLQKFPINALKIDKTLIDDIATEDSASFHILDTLVSLCKKLNIETIAEGVELEEQLNILKEIDCNTVQGFFNGKPMSIFDCEKLLRKR